MNIKYFKRELVLYNLGIPLSNTFIEHLNRFKSILDFDNLEIIEYPELYPYSIFWLKGGEIIFKYDEYDKIVFVDYDKIWTKVYREFRIRTYKEIISFLTCLFSVCLKLDICETMYLLDIDKKYNINEQEIY